MRITMILFICSCAAFMTSCGGKSYVRDVAPNQSYEPEVGKAMLVFMRPSGVGYAASSSLHEVVGDDFSFIGILPSKDKIAVSVDAGLHLYGVRGESYDFMSADLEAGKTYYALVTPRVGFMGARFSLKPMHKEDLGTENFSKWFDVCEWVKNNESAYAWAEKRHDSFVKYHRKYLDKWKLKAEKDRPHLSPTDGK